MNKQAYPTPEMLAWGEAYALWIETAQAYDDARADGGFFPSELAKAEMETAFAAKDAYQAARQDWVTWEILCGWHKWEPDVDLAAEWAKHNAARSQRRHPEQLYYIPAVYGG